MPVVSQKVAPLQIVRTLRWLLPRRPYRKQPPHLYYADEFVDYADEFVDDVSGKGHSTGNTVLFLVQTSKH